VGGGFLKNDAKQAEDCLAGDKNGVSRSLRLTSQRSLKLRCKTNLPPPGGPGRGLWALPKPGVSSPHFEYRSYERP